MPWDFGLKSDLLNKIQKEKTIKERLIIYKT